MSSTLQSPVENVYGIGPEQGQVLRQNGVSTLGRLVSEYRHKGPKGFKAWMREEGLGIEGNQLARVTNGLEAYCQNRDLPISSGSLDEHGGEAGKRVGVSTHGMSWTPPRTPANSQVNKAVVNSHIYPTYVTVSVNRVLATNTRPPRLQKDTRPQANLGHSPYISPGYPSHRQPLRSSPVLGASNESFQSHLGQVHTDVVITYIREE